MFKLALLCCCASLVAVCAANDPYAYAPAPVAYNSRQHQPSAYYKPSAPAYGGGAAGAYKQDDYNSQHAKYSFNYAVKDDYYNDFGHSESRDGDKTEGQYYVLLPDGRVQYVKYYVDGHSGYVAQVSYSGEPKYDNAYNKPAPSYKVDSYAPAPQQQAYYKADPYRSRPAAASSYQQPTTPYEAPAPYRAPSAYAPAPYKPQQQY